MKNRFYVYVYLREDRYTPYYVGKGCGYRCYKKHSVPVPKDRSRIIKIKENLSEKESLGLEETLIRFWGRKDIGTGVLHNLTEGGEGVSGVVPYNRTEETKQKLRKSIQEHWKTRPRRKPKTLLSHQERSSITSKGMTNHWGSQKGEEQKELYRERNRVRIQKIVDSLDIPDRTKGVLFFGKVFVSQREVSRLTGVTRTYIRQNSVLVK